MNSQDGNTSKNSDNNSSSKESKKTIEDLQNGSEQTRNGYGDRDHDKINGEK